MTMNSYQAMWIAALALTLLAGWTDWRKRKIPNWLTVSGFFLGVAMNFVLWGWRNTNWHGGKASMEGAALGLAVFLPFVLLRALGAGDWKLMGAVGAIFGPALLVLIIFGSIFVAGIMAVIEVVRSRRIKETAKNLAVLVHGFFTFGVRSRPDITLDNPGLMKIPFGVAVAMATVICYGAALWRS
ncbi:MAG TPA: A24 family peptidase [Candidatus Acidoferrales bacterium]|nr:A24 family peptidase [Candidatus Acidoferrales bacterium]